MQTQTTELQLSNAEIQSFDALKKETTTSADACNKLTVTDSVSLAIATQNLSKANQYIKDIEKIRKELKAPYFDAGKKIDALADALSSPLEKTLAEGKAKILAYNKIEEAKALAEQQRIIKIKNLIQTYYTNAIAAMNNCKVDAELIIEHNKFIKNFPADPFWSEFSGEAATMRTQLLDYAKARRIEIAAPKEADETVTETIKEQIEETVLQVSQQAESVKFTTTTAFRGTWKEEIVDITKMPLEWLMPDEKKIKAYGKEFRESITDGDVINGVRFFVDKSVTIR